MHETISCLLATRNRPQFLEQAVRCFTRQTHSNSELTIVDDSDRETETFCPACDRITYIRLEKTTPLGTKMNIAVEASRGDFLQKLDDDDYYDPAFLATSVAHLANNSSDRVVAWDSFLILFAGEERVRFSGRGWAAGGTLSFSRKLWHRNAFRDIPKDVDRFFLIDHGYRVLPVHAPEQYIMVRHGRNTWTKMQEYETDGWLRSRPQYCRSLKDLVGSDYEFYRTLDYRS